MNCRSRFCQAMLGLGKQVTQDLSFAINYRVNRFAQICEGAFSMSLLRERCVHCLLRL
jgi:hypothetical protein